MRKQYSLRPVEQKITAHRFNRRQFLTAVGLGSIASLVAASCARRAGTASIKPLEMDQSTTSPVNGLFQLPPLPYAYNALEPHIDELTMQLHHSRHHQTYVDNLNDALANHPDWRQRNLMDVLKNLALLPQEIRTKVRNNGGGHLNHTIFWSTLGPGKGGTPTGELGNAIAATFGSFDAMKAQMSNAAASVFGSGWAWLVANPQRKLQIVSTANQDTPYTEGVVPLVGIDVWEHAYYLKYQNSRADYISAWWNVVNWDAVAQRFVSQ